jgi:hypothetical protein
MLHAAYGLGCAISPIVATRMVAAGLGWNSYYYVLLGWAIANTTTIAITYHPKFMLPKHDDEEMTESPTTDASTTPPKLDDSSKLDDSPAANSTTPLPRKRGPLRIVLTNRLCWMLALYLVLYLGLEISTGGWVVEFMIQVPSPPANSSTQSNCRSAMVPRTKCPTSPRGSGSASLSVVSSLASPLPVGVKSVWSGSTLSSPSASNSYSGLYPVYP